MNERWVKFGDILWEKQYSLESNAENADTYFDESKYVREYVEFVLV